MPNSGNNSKMQLLPDCPVCYLLQNVIELLLVYFVLIYAISFRISDFVFQKRDVVFFRIVYISDLLICPLLILLNRRLWSFLHHVLHAFSFVRYGYSLFEITIYALTSHFPIVHFLRLLLLLLWLFAIFNSLTKLTFILTSLDTSMIFIPKSAIRWNDFLSRYSYIFYFCILYFFLWWSNLYKMNVYRADTKD